MRTDRKFIFFIIFLLLGALLAVQFRSTLSANRQKASAALNLEKLRTRINEEKEIETSLKSEIEYHNMLKERYLKAFIEKSNNDKLLAERERIRLMAGLTRVNGPGITIRLDDALARQNEDPSLLIIHDQDIRIILNDLKKAGAAAISINGERIVNTSEQVCAGPTILINKNRYPVPYVINAIGDPDSMYDMMMQSERIGLMLQDKIRVEITKSKEVVVPEFSQSDKLGNFISLLEVVKK